MDTLINQLRARLAKAFHEVAGGAADPVVRRSQHADYQADGALPLARTLKKPPREIATEIVQKAALNDWCSEVSVTGPGFINMTINAARLSAMVNTTRSCARLGVAIDQQPQTIIVDYSAPNVAKEMHVGHLRSTFIGDVAVRLQEWLGHTVVRENHIGDWGTPFGMLIEHLVDNGGADAADELSVGDLDGFYKAARVKFDSDEAFAERSRQRVVLLQGGDKATLKLWKILISESEKYFMTVYQQIGVRLTQDDFVGESFYNDQLESVVNELHSSGLLTESQGAKCVFPEGFVNRDEEPLPLIVRKSDGGFGYAATDLATIRHRIQELHADRILYVVGAPQSLHFQMIFQVAREANWLKPPIRAQHVEFGSILGTDGKLLRSRAGTSIKLAGLIDEAIRRAEKAITEKNPDLDLATREAVARDVGIGAIKYADLSTERNKDYVFDFDRMLAFEGNTAPYLQYAHARICSIFRKTETGEMDDIKATSLIEPAERKLALELLGFGNVVTEVADNLEFHRLARYLYELATAFMTFYQQCPVLRSSGDTRASRLALCDLTRRTLAQGLSLMGINSPEQM